jgi:hypothetical protein
MPVGPLPGCASCQEFIDDDVCRGLGARRGERVDFERCAYLNDVMRQGDHLGPRAE